MILNNFIECRNSRYFSCVIGLLYSRTTVKNWHLLQTFHNRNSRPIYTCTCQCSRKYREI